MLCYKHFARHLALTFITPLTSALDLRKYRFLAKHYGLGKEIVEKPRNEQCRKVAPHHRPAEYPFKQQQEKHLYQETQRRRDVEHHETAAEVGCASVLYAALPYPTVRAKEVAQHRKLERDYRRHDIIAHVCIKHIRGAQPQHKRVNASAEQPAYDKLYITKHFISK